MAFFLLAVTGITDFLDGYIARHHNQVTTIGKIIDPSVDRVVLITSVVCVVAFGAVPVGSPWSCWAARSSSTATVLVLAALGAARIDVNWFGKAGTFGLMCDLPLFVLAHGPGGWTHAVEITAWVIVVPALAFSFWGAVLYVPPARRALAAGHRGARTGRRHEQAPRNEGPGGRGARREGSDHGRRRGDPAAPADLEPAQADAADGQHPDDGARGQPAAAPTGSRTSW